MTAAPDNPYSHMIFNFGASSTINVSSFSMALSASNWTKLFCEVLNGPFIYRVFPSNSTTTDTTITIPNQGGYPISLSCTNYDTFPVSINISSISLTLGGIDLSVSPPNVTQPGSIIGQDGLQIISPGTPVTVTVPLAGINIDAQDSRSTVVTLQAGAQTQSQIVSLADIQSGNVNSATFNVTYGSRDIGTQIITATIDPNNALQENNFANNTSSIQVRVQPKYKLIASLDGNNTPIADCRFGREQNACTLCQGMRDTQR
jgi:hypothetical protein